MKKQKLIDALLELIKPEDWPEEYGFAAQDNSDGEIYIYKEIPYANWAGGPYKLIARCEPRKMNKLIVLRSDFVERYLKNLTVIKVPKLSQEHTEELKRHFNDQSYLKALCHTPNKETEDLKKQFKPIIPVNSVTSTGNSIKSNCEIELSKRIDKARFIIWKACNEKNSMNKDELQEVWEILVGKDNE
jgi:hypothetical protein